jgi:hypothetical protein
MKCIKINKYTLFNQNKYLTLVIWQGVLAKISFLLPIPSQFFQECNPKLENQ